MWQLLDSPHNSMAVYMLVGEAWGKLSFEDIVAMHTRSVTFGWIAWNQFLALANLIPIEAMHSARLNLWLCEQYRSPKTRDVYACVCEMWQSLHTLVFEELKLKVIVATTRSQSVQRLAARYGAQRGETIYNLYGQGQHGYNIIWD